MEADTTSGDHGDEPVTNDTQHAQSQDSSYNLRSNPKPEPHAIPEQYASLCGGKGHKDKNPDEHGQGDVGEKDIPNGAVGDNNKRYKPDNNPDEYGQGADYGEKDILNGAVGDNNTPDNNPGEHGQGDVGEKVIPNGAAGDNNIPYKHPDKHGQEDVVEKDIPNGTVGDYNKRYNNPGEHGQEDVGEKDMPNGAVGDNNKPDNNPDEHNQEDVGEKDIPNGAVGDYRNAEQDGLRRRPLREEGNRGNEANNIINEEDDDEDQYRGLRKAQTGLKDLVDGIREECSYRVREAYHFIRNTTVGEFFAVLWMNILQFIIGVRRKTIQLCNKIWEKRWDILKVLGIIAVVLLIFRIISMVAETQDEVEDFQKFVESNNARYKEIIKTQNEEVDGLHEMNSKLRAQLKAVEEGHETLIGDGGELAAMKKEIVNVKNDFENFMVKSQAHIMEVQNEMQAEVGKIRDDVGGVRNDHKRIEFALNSIEYNIRNIKNCGLLSRLFGWC